MTCYNSHSAAIATATLVFAAAAVAEIDLSGNVANRSADFAVGADLSFLSNAEEQGIKFKDDGVVKPGLEMFRQHGYNWVRLRLFHTPDRLPNDLEYTIASATEAKRLGYKFLLNFHYSDTWADPGKQFVPKAWEGQSQEELVESVRQYTRDCVAAFCEAGTRPDMVQIGNEVISGMLWPYGKLPDHWPEFAALFRAGVAGVRDACGDETPLIMMHIDRGGDREATDYFFNHCKTHSIEFDVMGLSYYPWWHGSLDDLRENLAFVSNTFDKDVYLVEVAYNWRKSEYPKGDGPYPETPEGQRQFLHDVTEVVLAAPNHRGKGVFWWEPAVAGGPIHSRGMFDSNNNALPVIRVFDRPAATNTEGAPQDASVPLTKHNSDAIQSGAELE